MSQFSKVLLAIDNAHSTSVGLGLRTRHIIIKMYKNKHKTVPDIYVIYLSSLGLKITYLSTVYIT